MNRRKRSPMDRTVAYRELEDLKNWMVDHFVTKQEFIGFKSEANNKFGSLENKITTLEDKMTTGFDKVWGSLEGLKQELILLNGAVRRIEGN